MCLSFPIANVRGQGTRHLVEGTLDPLVRVLHLRHPDRFSIGPYKDASISNFHLFSVWRGVDNEITIVIILPLDFDRLSPLKITFIQ